MGYAQSDRPAHLQDRHVATGPFRETAVLQRRDGGQWNNDGVWVPGAAQADRTISIVTAPSSGGGSEGGEERAVEVEGVRRIAERWFWTNERLVPVADDTVGDRLVWGGSTWLIIRSGEWGAGVWEAEAVRVDRA